MNRFSVVTIALSVTLIFSAENLFAGASERILSPDETLSVKVEQYGLVSFAKEKVYLDRLARRLRRKPEVTSHIIIYGRYKRKDQARADRIKNYLIQKQRINPYRVIIERQYCQAYSRAELWIVPLGAVDPAPFCP